MNIKTLLLELDKIEMGFRAISYNIYYAQLYIDANQLLLLSAEIEF